MIYKKVCPICGKEFKTIYPNKKSCSKNCLRKYKNEYHKAWRAGKTEMYQCMMEHNNCFSCPTSDGECLFD